MATPNPIQPIQPVNVPSAAGINYGEGDVRHFSQGDDMSVPGISNPTRQLAERDNMLAEKLNEVIQNVNNQEQFVPLPVVRTIVPPVDQTVVLNYRIPPGFESRVLNASVGSNPVNSDIELDIYFNAGFGGATGTAVVTTSSEFSGGVNFYQTGEFIVTLKNKSGVTLEMVASILLTLRPIGAQGSLLVGSVIQGKKGDPGQAGPPGIQGPPGSGGVSAPGMVWSGSWTYNTVYQQKQVVRYDLDGPLARISSFFCLQANTAGPANAPDVYALLPQTDPQANPYWTAVAAGGTNGGQGPIGPAGPSGSTTFTGNETTCYGTFTAGTPFAGGAYFDTQFNQTAYNTYGVANPGDTLKILMSETLWYAVGAGYPKGISLLNANIRTIFSGWGTLVLPKTSQDAHADYDTGTTKVSVAINGTVQHDYQTSGTTYEVVHYPHPSLTDRWIFCVLNDQPTPVSIQVTGMKLI